MRIVFMGTPDFAVPSLEKLRKVHTVLAVVTQPDRPRGRGQKLRPTPVKKTAQKHGLDVLQPESVAEEGFRSTLKGLSPEGLVVVAFGQKIPRSLLNLTPYGCINLHASLLPEYRGAAPLHWAIINGEQETGLTTMFMSEDWDAGDIIYQKRIPIGEDETVGELHDRMAEQGAELLARTITDVEHGDNPRQPQEESRATYAPQITSEDARIDWSQPAGDIFNLIRGTAPWPGAFTFWQGQRLKIYDATPFNQLPEELVCREDLEQHLPAEHGTVVACIKEGLLVAAGKGFVLLEEVQPANRQRMSAADFMLGYEIEPGLRLQQYRESGD